MPLPSKGAFLAKPQAGPARQLLEDMLAVQYRTLGGAPSESAEITAADTITPSGDSAHIIINCNGASTEDTLTRILPDNFEEGNIILLQLENAGEKITVEHEGASGADGEIVLNPGIDALLSSQLQVLAMQLVGSKWLQQWKAGSELRRIVGDPGEPAYDGNWYAGFGGVQNLAFYKDGENRVHWAGRCRSSLPVFSTPTKILDVPVGYRPLSGGAALNAHSVGSTPSPSFVTVETAEGMRWHPTSAKPTLGQDEPLWIYGSYLAEA